MPIPPFKWLRLALIVVLVALSSGVSAQNAKPREKQPVGRDVQESWLAWSNTASSITGDIRLSSTILTMVRRHYPLRLVRDIDAQNLSDAARIVGAEHPTAARLYRTMIPATAKLLNGNDICGLNDANWVLAVNDRLPDDNEPTLALAFFSGDREPDFDDEVVSNNTDLCGTYGYGH
jgi:hypothetical protein